MSGKGIYLAVAAFLGIGAVFWEFLIVFAIFLLFLFWLTRYKSFHAKLLLLVCCVFSLNCLVGTRAEIANKTVIKPEQTSFHLVFNDWKINGDKLQITAKDTLTNEKLIIDYRLKSNDEKRLLQEQNLYGKKCVLTGQLETPSPARNPNAFDYQVYLSTKQIYWIFTVDDFPIQTCSPTDKSIFSILHLLRYKGIHFIQEQFPEPTATLAVALLFGDRTSMPGDIITAYQTTGLVHILAISGLHVSLLTGMIFFIGIRMGVVREEMLTGLILALPIYAFLTGASPSVVRAVIMTMLLLGCVKISSKRLLPIDALSGAFMLMMLVSPYIIFDIGFQLSFTCSCALLLSTSLTSRIDQPFLKLFVVSFIAQIASLPILLWNFYEFSLISLPANAFFVPFFSVILLPSIFFLFIFSPFFNSLLSPVFSIVNSVIMLVNSSIVWLSQLSFPLMIMGRPDWWMLFAYLLMFLLFFIKWDKGKNRQKSLPLVLLLFTPFLLQAVLTKSSPTGEITFIDVGQGDAILIKLPFERGTYLIDAGGSVPFAKEAWQMKNKEFEVGKNVVIPFLKSKGINSIDKLILTHGDFDHIGGAAAIIEAFHVEEIIFPKTESISEVEKETRITAERNHVKIQYVSEGDGWISGDSVFRVLSPATGEIGEDRNDSSIVIVAEIGGVTWLFSGDLEAEGEIKLAKRYPELDIDVLKVAHHGSKSSTTDELLSTFSPNLAIISVGSENRYGHPHQEVIKRLETKGTSILRTDQHGAISYFFKRKSGTISTMLP